MDWAVVLALGVGSYALRVTGLTVTNRRLPAPLMTVLELLPAPLLAALVVVHTVGAGAGLAVDARLPAIAAAGVAVHFRAPIIVVLVVAVGVAAGLRAAGWG